MTFGQQCVGRLTRRFVLCGFALLLVATGACSGSGDSFSTPPSRAAMSAALAAHGKAVMAHDQSAFVAGLDADKKARSFKTAQENQFDNLALVPLSHWSYTLGPRADDTESEAAARRKFGPSAVIIQITLHYALRGFDAIPTRRDLWWTFVRTGRGVRVAADNGLVSAGGVSWQGPWDFGPLSVVRGRSALVLGHPDNTAAMRAIAAAVDAAVPAVTGVWGTGWPRRVAVIVPSSDQELSAALGPTSSVTADVAAIAGSDGQDALTGKVYGQRLVVEPKVFAKLSPVGARIIVTHEITHIADASATSDSVPRWLVEGFADYVGNLHTGQTVRFAASELRAEVARGQVPTGFPSDADFDGAGTAAQAYEASWLACRLIAARAGQAGLVRFYRLVGASPEAGDDAVAAALRSVLHERSATFVAQWRSYLRAQLG